MMKQLRVLLVAVFFLHSKIGVAFNVHYCGKHIAEISWAFDAKGCGMEKENLSLDFSDQLIQKTCCEDDSIISQNTSDQTKSEVKSQSVLVNSTRFYQFNCGLKMLSLNRIDTSCNHPPPPKIHIYKKNCSFIFYG